jgi:hypothetical protein
MNRLLSFNRWSTSNSINENIQSAKLFLTKRYVARQEGIRVEDVTREQAEDRENQRKALDNDFYRGILNIVGSNHGYVYPFVKFVVNCRATLDELRDLYSNITKYAGSLKSLSMSIDEYSKVPTVDGKRSIDALLGEFENIKDSKDLKKHDWIIEQVHASLRNSIKAALTRDQIKRLLSAAAIIDGIDKRLGEQLNPKTGNVLSHKSAFLSKTNAFSSATEYLERAEDKARGVKQINVNLVANNAAKLEPNAHIIYQDDTIIAIAIRTEAAQKELCSLGEWCINRNAWNSYGGASKSIQINIFDFNKTMQDPMHLTGTTITNGKVTASHDLYDAGIKDGSDPTTHFTKLGYSNQIVSEIVSSIDSELLIKELVTGVGLDARSPAKSLRHILISGYSSNILNQQIKTILSGFVENHIIGNISDTDAISVFSELGILSEFSAKIFNMLNLQDTAKNTIIAKNQEIITSLNTIINRLGYDFNKKATTIVQESDKISEILQNGDTILDDIN